jgi:hypothetical protein
MDIDTSMDNLSIEATESIETTESIHNNQIDMSILENMTNLSMYNHEDYETYTDYDTIEMNKQIDNNTYKNQYTNKYTNQDTNPELDEYDKYDNSPYVCFGIPNIYCTVHFDDEDFIFNRYDILNDMKKYIKINNSIDEYASNYCIGNGIIVDYSSNNDNPDIIYAKILYIYQYVHMYYKDLRNLQPSERIRHLPETLLVWIENIVTILRKVINDNSLKCESFVEIEDMYFKELVYGLNIINCQLRLMLNHYKRCTLWQLEDKHIKQFFKIVNNMCVIIIFMKLNNKDSY